MKNQKNYTLIFLIVLSTCVFSILGHYWNIQYYRRTNTYTASTPPLTTAMRGLHDKLYLSDLSSFNTNYAVSNLVAPTTAIQTESTDVVPPPLTDIATNISDPFAKGKLFETTSHRLQRRKHRLMNLQRQQKITLPMRVLLVIPALLVSANMLEQKMQPFCAKLP